MGWEHPPSPNCLWGRGVGDGLRAHLVGRRRRGPPGPLTAPETPFYDARRLTRTAAAVPRPGGFCTTCRDPVVFLPRVDTSYPTLARPSWLPSWVIVCRGRAARDLPVLATDPLKEFRTAWLPHVSDEGLRRLSELLEKGSPLLVHGAFTRAMPMGCLASHVAWNHPATAHLQHDAGVMWLCRVARLNPATSAVILAWDRAGLGDFELRTGLQAACEAEVESRASFPVPNRGTGAPNRNPASVRDRC